MHENASRFLDSLNDEQQRAVLTTEGPVLVVAGPGSGKTRVLTHRIAFLLEEKRVHPSRILAVTFTNKAAREMRDRIDRLSTPGVSDGLVMGTFHAFGVRVLRQNPGLVADQLKLLPNFLIYDSGDQSDIAKRAIVGAGLDPKQVAPRRMLAKISEAKSNMLTPKEVQDAAETYDDELVARVYSQYERLIRDANAVDFDDLLGLPIRLFDQVPSLLEHYQKQFQYIMVDEYQDTNRVQYVLISALADHYQNLFVVGDPDQSIYAWRNADIRNILDFKQDYPSTTEIHLETNYRSTKRIVAAADQLIQDNKDRIDRRITTHNTNGGQIQLRELADHNHEAQFVVSEIRRLLTSGEYSPEQIAIMYRTTAQSRVLEEAFRVTDLPYRIVGGVRFYERREVRDVLAVLRLLHNPSDRLSLERVLANMPIGKGFGPKAMDVADEWAMQQERPLIDAFLVMSPTTTPGEVSKPEFSSLGRGAAERIGTVLSILRERAQSESLAELFDSIVHQTKYQEHFRNGTEEELQRWANVLELRSDLSRYDAVDPGEALAVYLEQVSLIADVDAMSDEDQEQITLITLHSAKGLEFPVVFVTGVEEGLLPISRAIEAEAFDRLPMEEERRLLYVGITRAEQRLYLTYAASRLTFGKFQQGVASRFLNALPVADMHRVTRATGTTSGRRNYGSGQSAAVQSGRLAQKVSSVRTSDWTSGSSNSVDRSAATVIPDYQPGQKVFHPKFGEGEILDVLPRTADNELSVNFSRHGQKRLMASLARMDILGEP